MQNNTSNLIDANLQNKRVLLRADLNVPIKNGRIVDDFRLKALLPTIDLIQKKGGKIILATHIGRPKKPGAELSTEILIPWFEQQGYHVHFAPDLDDVPGERDQTIVLLDNVRFYPEEKKQDLEFAKKLANLADYYVNDAFALLHRDDTSITIVPKFFNKDHRFFGPLIKEELNALNRLLEHPKKPFVLILGGGKVATKLPLIKHMVGRTDYIILCPAIVFTFLKALGKEIGKSLVDEQEIPEAKKIIELAHKKGTKILFPVDYQVAQNTLDGPLSIVSADHFSPNSIGISIGPKSISYFKPYILDAGTIFFNCGMGFLDRPKTLEGLQQLLEIVAQSKAYTVIGGGESIAAARLFNFSNNVNHLSTGGGATLTYLTGHPLPGLLAMQY